MFKGESTIHFFNYIWLTAQTIWPIAVESLRHRLLDQRNPIENYWPILLLDLPCNQIQAHASLTITHLFIQRYMVLMLSITKRSFTFRSSNVSACSVHFARTHSAQSYIRTHASKCHVLFFHASCCVYINHRLACNVPKAAILPCSNCLKFQILFQKNCSELFDLLENTIWLLICSCLPTKCSWNSIDANVSWIEKSPKSMQSFVLICLFINHVLFWDEWVVCLWCLRALHVCGKQVCKVKSTTLYRMREHCLWSNTERMCVCGEWLVSWWRWWLWQFLKYFCIAVYS